MEFLNDLIRLGPSSRFGLLLHWYRGSVEGERIKIKHRERVKLPRTRIQNGSVRIEEDVLYEVVR